MYCKSILSKNLISNTSLSRNGSSSKLFNTHERFEFHSKSTSKIFLKSNYQSSSSIVINNNNNVKNNSNSNFFGKNNRLFSMAKKINEEPMKTETKILADGAISGNRSFIAKAITLGLSPFHFVGFVFSSFMFVYIYLFMFVPSFIHVCYF